MYNSKVLYGQTFLDFEDLMESEIDYPVELEYYKTNTSNEGIIAYGIEIIKKEYLEDITKVEIKRRNLFTKSEEQVEQVLEMLKRGKVTPMGLKDSLNYVIKKLQVTE